MTPAEERIDKVLDALSHARTALDDPSGLPEEDFRSWNEGEHNEYTSRIDDAMRLLSPEKKYGLVVALDGEFTTRAFDARDEGPTRSGGNRPQGEEPSVGGHHRHRPLLGKENP